MMLFVNVVNGEENQYTEKNTCLSASFFTLESTREEFKARQ